MDATLTSWTQTDSRFSANWMMWETCLGKSTFQTYCQASQQQALQLLKLEPPWLNSKLEDIPNNRTCSWMECRICQLPFSWEALREASSGLSLRNTFNRITNHCNNAYQGLPSVRSVRSSSNSNQMYLHHCLLFLILVTYQALIICSCMRHLPNMLYNPTFNIKSYQLCSSKLLPNSIQDSSKWTQVPSQ
jgi:hypothetical protein